MCCLGKCTTKMEMVPLEKLVPYVNNARTHSPEQVNKLRSSLREFGFVNPVIIDKDYSIIAGHGRVMAAREENMDAVPCVLVDYLTDAQKKAYILADNRLAMDAGWDEELLRMEIEALQGEDFDISLTGFDEKELSDLFGTDDGAGQEDGFDVEEELQKPCFSKSGDLWHLGRHTVICGDSTLTETYQRLLAGAQVNLVCTDPPYLVNLESTSGKIKNDDLSDEEGYTFLKGAFSCMHDSMAKDASIYVFYATSKARVFHDAYEDAGFKVGAGLVWKKNRLVLTRTDWKYIHEPIIWGWRKDGKHNWYADRKQSTIWNFDRPSKNDLHPTMKPVALCAYPITNSSLSNCIVLDPFGGSGSTLLACEQTKRRCYMVELDEKFCDVIVKRYIEQVGSDERVTVTRNGKTYTYTEMEAT